MYQRNYAWKAEQVTAFLEDIKTAMESNEDHFFGSVVLLSPEDNKSPFSVIDGQQRLTTFMLLISVIRDQIADFSDANYMLHGLPVNLDSITTGLLRSDSTYELRFDANNRIRDVFDNYILLEPAAKARKHLALNGLGLSSEEKKHTLELRRAYHAIKSWLHQLLLPNAGDEEAMKSKIFTLLTTVRTSAKILRIEVANEDDAFLLFETLNERGLRLTPSDLLKNFTLRKVTDSDALVSAEDALDRWDEAVDSLGDYPFTKFLRHFLLSSQDKDKVQVSKIFNMFKLRILGYGRGGAIRNLHELAEGAKNYAALLGDGSTPDDKLNRVIGRLNLLSETHRIVLLRAMHFRFSHEQIRKLAIALEVLAFRWIITGGNAQEIETFYQKQAGKFTSDNPTELAGVISSIISQAPGDDALKAAILQNPASRIADHQFYVLQRLNYGLTGSELVWSRKQLHIEHLAPQRPLATADWFTVVAPKQSNDPNEKVYDDYLNQWGNLTLLEYEINVQIGNAEWATKVTGRDGSPGLDHSSVSLTKNLVTLPAWGRDEIAARTLWISESMVQLTSLTDYHDPGMLAHFA